MQTKYPPHYIPLPRASLLLSRNTPKYPKPAKGLTKLSSSPIWILKSCSRPGFGGKIFT